MPTEDGKKVFFRRNQLNSRVRKFKKSKLYLCRYKSARIPSFIRIIFHPLDILPLKHFSGILHLQRKKKKPAHKSQVVKVSY